MKTNLTIITLIFGLTGLVSAEPAGSTPSEVAELIKSKGKLVFEDDFNREESDDSKEELGKDWVTNSKKRAAGTKQADLKGESILITMAKHADHGVSVRHDAPYDDGVIQARFKMHDSKGISFNFNDPKCKVSHAGHICAVGVKPNQVTLRDGKTGIFDLKIQAKKKSGASKKEINALTKDKFAYGKVKLETGKWYEITILVRGDEMSAWIDGEKVGKLKSPGLDHEVKQNIAFAVSGKAEVDQLRIWSLEK